MADQNQVDSYLMMNASKLPQESLSYLRNRLLELDDNRLTMIAMTPLKDPTMLLIVSVVGGALGIDRFLLGQVGLGIAKLLTGGGCGIWWLVDLFLISDETKRCNYNQIMGMLL